MKKVYTSENRLPVMNNKNILQNANIEVELRNEHMPCGAPGNLVWPDLWVSEKNCEKALGLLDTKNQAVGKDWRCQHCKQDNPSNMLVCWNCQSTIKVA